MVSWIPNHEKIDHSGVPGLKAGIVDNKESIYFVIIWVVASNEFCELTVRNTDTFLKKYFFLELKNELERYNTSEMEVILCLNPSSSFPGLLENSKWNVFLYIWAGIIFFSFSDMSISQEIQNSENILLMGN